MRFLESQIQMRARLDAEINERAYAELGSSVVSAKRAKYRSMGDAEQADLAACACLDYLGVTPGVVPDGVTDLDERLEYLCRPSGTMRRNVTLNEGWQRNTFGALISHLDTGESVALLPGRLHSYQVYEPGTGGVRHVSQEVAKHIDPNAIFFYRPLPNKDLGIRDLLAYMMSVFELRDYLLVILAATIATLVGFLPTWANNLVFGTVIPSGDLKLIAPISCLLVGVVASRAII